MRILVKGGAGFIGGHVVKRLSAMGPGDILTIDNLHRAFSRDSLPSGVDFHRSAIRHRDALAEAVRGCEAVFHLAAQSNVMAAVADADYSF